MSTYRVQKLVSVKPKPGQKKSGTWVTIATKSTKAVAEHFAKHAKIDNPNSQIRVEETGG